MRSWVAHRQDLDMVGDVDNSGAANLYDALETPPDPYLEDLETQLKLARPLPGAHSFEWQLDQPQASVTPGFRQLFGVPDGQPVTSEIIMSRVHPNDANRVRAGQEAVLTRAEPFEDEFRIVLPDGGIRWILARGQPLTSPTGTIIGLAGINMDITERKIAELRLKKREAELRERERMFRTLANAMPQMVWSARPDGYHDYFNDRWYEFTGVSPGITDGGGWANVFHPEDAKRAHILWQHALRTGETYEIEYRLRHHSGEYRWTLGRALPVRDTAGRITRWFGTCTDIHDAKSQAEQNVTLSQELKHRIKNVFALVQSVVSMTARAHPEVKGYADNLRDKIAALGRAHNLISVTPDHADMTPHLTLHHLLEEILKPYSALQEGRITITGSDTPLAPEAVTPLALVFHELATNASKYGALVAPEGCIAIAADIEDGMVSISWMETGGPAIAHAPSRSGFGTTLSAISVEKQLKGSLQRDWRPEGLLFTMRCPLEALQPLPKDSEPGN